MKPAEKQHRATDDRELGPRALVTRQKLLAATKGLLESGGLLDFRVVDVARAVGTSPATFYQYFPSVEDAILALCEEANAGFGEVLAIIEQGSFNGAKGLAVVRSLVDVFFSHFDEHRAILRVRNLSAQEGDQRFRKSRNDAVVPCTRALAARIEESQKAGKVVPEISAWAAAGGLMAMLERLAAFRYEFEARGVSRDAMVETAARIVHQTVTGRR